MSGWARPGVKCVCVDASDTRFGDPLFEGVIYTVAAVPVGRDSQGNNGVVLEEARSDHWTGAYKLRRFRPLVPPKTQEQDMEHFLPLLKTRELVE